MRRGFLNLPRHLRSPLPLVKTWKMLVIQSKWYHNQPLIIKGAGAGAEVTASGIMADIMMIAGSGRDS